MIISKKGEKQLLCLGRSLLSKAKIVLIDEATSSIDLDTETKIHKIIQENFRDVTVLGTHHQNTAIGRVSRVVRCPGSTLKLCFDNAKKQFNIVFQTIKISII